MKKYLKNVVLNLNGILTWYIGAFVLSLIVCRYINTVIGLIFAVSWMIFIVDELVMIWKNSR